MLSFVSEEMPDTVLCSASPHMTNDPSPSSSLWLFSILTPVSPCPSCTGEPSIGPSTPDVSHQCEVEGKNHLPLLAGNTFPNAAQDVNVFLFPEETVILNHWSTTCQWLK